MYIGLEAVGQHCVTYSKFSVDSDLGSLDVVVEVITECLNVRNNLLSPLRRQMPREQYWYRSADER